MESNTSAPTHQCKPLQPVNVRARLVGGATEQDLANGSAVLYVTDAVTGDEVAYWCEAVYNAGRRYSRADAIRYGVLIDVSATARAAGIRRPWR
jgi:hypothetical protein